MGELSTSTFPFCEGCPVHKVFYIGDIPFGEACRHPNNMSGIPKADMNLETKEISCRFEPRIKAPMEEMP